MVAVLAYVSLCSFTAFKGCGLDQPALPEVKYAIVVKVTGNRYLTDIYDVSPSSEAGKQAYTLHGYYEQVKGKYEYRDIVLQLDEKYFGDIEVRVLK